MGRREYSSHRANSFYELLGSQGKEGKTMSHMFSLSDSGALLNKSDLLISTFIRTIGPQFTRRPYFCLTIEGGLDGFRKPILGNCPHPAMNER